jgi:murein DD-endopeptidase MepM/ murein hydrolase activator NlpD
MMSLLAWLWDRAGRVYNVIDWIYGRIVDAAWNALTWAINEGTKAYNRAVTYVIGRVDYVFDVAWDWILWLQGVVDGWVRAARSYALDLYYTALVVIENAKNYVKSYASNLVDDVRSLATDLYYAALITIENAKNWVLSEVRMMIAPIFGNTDLLSGLLQFFGLPSVFDLLNMLYSFQGSLIAFFQNPLGFVYGVIRGTFITFLSYAIGYALGTVQADLPYWPSWGTDDVVIEWPPDQPPDTGGLAAPLTHIRVSGYTFNNPAGHMGIDLGPTSPFVVYAMHTGVVSIARWVSGGYANCIVISGNPWWTRYAHLASFNVSEGMTVRAGQPIAIGDSTGNSTGNHLHLEIKYNGSFIDPIGVL